ncbi:hypothetical protein GGI43DRAFT_388803 [Trichoderma evansii]
MDLPIARTLYLTVKLHAVENILSLLGSSEGIPLRNDSVRLVAPDETTFDESNWLAFHDDISEVFEDVIETPKAVDGLAYRAFCMLWPKMALLQSRLASPETQTSIRCMLRSLGVATGFGLCTLASGLEDAATPCS